MASIFHLLYKACSFLENSARHKSPFCPWWEAKNGSRGSLLEDFSPHDLNILKVLAQLSKNRALRARIYDILWLRECAPKESAEEACKAYIESALLQNTERYCGLSLFSFERSLFLASKLGRAKPLFKEILKNIATAAEIASEWTKSYQALKLVRLLFTEIKSKEIDSDFCISILRKVAEKEELFKSWTVSEKYRCHEVEWHLKLKNYEAAQIAQYTRVESLLRLAREKPLAASMYLDEARKGLAKVNVPREYIDSKVRQFLELQCEAPLNMKTFAYPIPTNELLEQIRIQVQDSELPSSLQKLALGFPPINLESIKKESNTPSLWQTVLRVKLDSKGRKIHSTKGSSNLNKEETLFENAITYWNCLFQFILTAQRKVWEEHKPSKEDILPLVQSNPFIPEDREEFFLRGLYGGLSGDFALAIHFLVPQVESSIRHMLKGEGVTTISFKADDAQELKSLNQLLLLDKTTDLLGEDIVFCLRGCLSEKVGYNLRNDLAHGLISAPDLNGPESVFTWWLVLRICFSLKLAAEASQQKQDSGGHLGL